jgi:putative SOS response-associated peptidase YedK
MYRDKEGRELKTFTIITIPPNALVERIHDRMDAILEEQDEAEWLNPDETEPERLLKLLHPYPASEMDAYPVSRLVNSPKNDTKTVIEPATDLG